MKKNNKIKKIIILILIILFFLIIFSTIFSIYYSMNNNIVEGIEIQGISVSGITKENAENKLKEIINNLEKKEIIINYNNYENKINLNELEINIYFFSRILGVLLDNAIEAAENSKEKFVKISFIRENINSRAIITIENSYDNKNINIDNIFKKGITSKEGHAGLGLWEVKRYVNKSKNLDLKPSSSSNTFKQELFIYDL